MEYRGFIGHLWNIANQSQPIRTMNKHYLTYMSLACMAIFGFSACKDKSFDSRTENMNKGTITIYAEAEYRVLVEELIQSYENVYPESDIQPVFGTDAEVMDALLQDKARMAFIGHALSEKQIKAMAKQQEIEPEQFLIGREAIAIIASYDYPDSIFYFDAFLQGKTGESGNASFTPQYVFNAENSNMITQLLGGSNAHDGMFSLSNADTVIGYVARNPKAVGFISFAAISDFDDPEVQEILSKVQVLQVAHRDSTGKEIVTPLSQSTIATREYPFQRYVTVVKGNTPELLGTGFVNFLYRSKASRIMLKAGLVPEKMPERQVKIVE